MKRIFALCVWIVGLVCVGICISRACTIFVLTDANHSLFFNSEDWENPRSRIWFIPGDKHFYGCAYVGFDTGWPEGGVNTEGLACDWVAGFTDDFKLDETLHVPRGSPTQRMLETCATVEQAVDFFRTNREPGFSRARVLIADRTGASVIIGAKNGKLNVEQSRDCRGFGYHGDIVEERLAKKPAATVEEGAKILRDSVQKGKYATKYSNAFDLRTGDIFVYEFNHRGDGIKLNIRDELQKGAHFYDIPKLAKQLKEPIQPLAKNMERLVMNRYKPIKDDRPEVAARLKTTLADWRAGKPRRDDHSEKLWNELTPQLQQVQDELKKLGALRDMARVENQPQDPPWTFRYRIDFQNALILMRVIVDEHGRFASIETEDTEPRPPSS